MSKRPNLKKIKEELRELHGEMCSVCGQSDISLELAHIIPMSKGGSSDLDNLMLICPNCHYQYDRHPFREIDLTNYLVTLLNKNPEFKSVHQEVALGDSKRYRADIITETDKGDNLLIEIKSLPAYSKSRLESVIEQLKTYGSVSPKSKLIFAFPGLLPEESKERFKKENIEIWDQHFISSKFRKEISETPHPVFHMLFGSPIGLKDEEKLIAELHQIKSGKKDWYKYEKLVERIMDNLFGKTLSTPISNHSDNSKANRRDIILANYCESGFWAYMREKYSADYIVIDAKNYSKKVQKKEVLQIANYLKRHGTGLFGILISRNGEDRGSNITRREIWATDQKLIIVLDDNDIISMLSSKSPEAVIKQNIEDFRLSI